MFNIQIKPINATRDFNLPMRATPGSAGFDLRASFDGAKAHAIKPQTLFMVPTNLQLTMPIEIEGQIRSRSGMAVRNLVTVMHGVGTVDSDYRGEVFVPLYNHHPTDDFIVAHGDRIAQLVFAFLPNVYLRAINVPDQEPGFPQVIIGAQTADFVFDENSPIIEPVISSASKVLGSKTRGSKGFGSTGKN